MNTTRRQSNRITGYLLEHWPKNRVWRVKAGAPKPTEKICGLEAPGEVNAALPEGKFAGNIDEERSLVRDQLRTLTVSEKPCLGDGCGESTSGREMLEEFREGRRNWIPEI